MSYDLAIWEGERPNSDEKAAQVYEELSERYEEDTDEPPSLRLLGFARDLTHRYPDATDLPDDRVEESPWAYGPLTENVTGSLFTVGVRFDMVKEVAPFVARMAREHGLVCFDPQEETLGVPSVEKATVDPEAQGFLENALDIVARAFEGSGYARAGRNVFTCRLQAEDEAVGQIELSQHWIRADGAHAARIRLGVVHMRLAQLYETLTESEKVVIGGVDLVRVAPQGTYRFAPGSDNEASARAMVEAVESHARPFMERLARLEATRCYLQQGPLMPLVLALQGKGEEARGIVSGAIRVYEGRTDRWAEDYREFAARFLEWLDSRDETGT
jgi:hypothetical protein